MASKRGSIKVAYDLSRDSKYNLTMLKAELRHRGIKATETGILELLIDMADLEALSRAYRKLG